MNTEPSNQTGTPVAAMSGLTPALDAVEMTMSLGGRTERLLENEYLLIEQLISYREQTLTGETLKDTIGLAPSAPDRLVRSAMSRLIQKTNALYPAFPLIRKIDSDLWIYTEVAPKKKRRRGRSVS